MEGAYLSPFLNRADTRKNSDCRVDRLLSMGITNIRGWRYEMEDAEVWEKIILKEADAGDWDKKT